ncbi:MAG: hypothetical protein CMG44_00845 [Candidatus Marinimicrobia bacterium]|nr:hypothetical protein [Candidatus Neomarinimicrobiota bacterium]
MLSKKIKEYLDRCVASNFTGKSSEHPIIALNAIKNIIGDNQIEPSNKLIELLKNKAHQFPAREDDQNILNEVAKDGLGLTIFVSDLEDACQTGIPDEIERQAARLQWVSDNGLGGLEALVEVALQDFEILGTFAFHLLRSNFFNRDIKNTWPYTRCLLKEICKKPLPEPHEQNVIECNLFKSENKLKIIDLCSAHRLWNGDYVRSIGYKREISHWVNDQEEKEYIEDNKKVSKDLQAYYKNGGNFFIEIAEELIDNDEDLIFLESLRYLIKCREDYLPYTSYQISQLLKKR